MYSPLVISSIFLGRTPLHPKLFMSELHFKCKISIFPDSTPIFLPWITPEIHFFGSQTLPGHVPLPGSQLLADLQGLKAGLFLAGQKLFGSLSPDYRSVPWRVLDTPIFMPFL